MTLNIERGKQRGNRTTESVQISCVDLMLKGNHESNVLQPGYFTFSAVVKLHRKGWPICKKDASPSGHCLNLLADFAKGWTTQDGGGGMNVINQSPKCQTYEGQGNSSEFLQNDFETILSCGKTSADLRVVESCQREHLESFTIQAWQGGWVLDRLGLLRMVFSGWGKQQLVTCQMSVANLGKGWMLAKYQGEGSWLGFLWLLVQATNLLVTDNVEYIMIKEDSSHCVQH